MKRCLAPILVLLCFLAPAVRGADERPAAKSPADVVAGAVKAANDLLATLDKSQQEKLLFPFDDEQQRVRWSNFPNGMFPRRGLRMGDLTGAQRDAVFGLLKATLSERGVREVMENMDGDETLKQNESGHGGGGRGGRGPAFGKADYYVSILGKPSTTEPWMFQFGGHHLAINATILKARITLSPSLTGGQPVDYTLNGKSVRQLGNEEDTAYELIAVLTPEQLKQAVLSDRPDDLRFGPGAEGVKPKDEGIKASSLDDKQKKLLLELIEERIGVLNETHSKLLMDAISRDLDKTWFSWHGPTEKGKAASFRIQGPTVLIEYCPQRLGGDATEHTHAMHRDPTNDYGAGMLQK